MKPARKEFDRFPLQVRQRIARALDVAAFGQKADIAKPMRGIGIGVTEIALPYSGDAYRAVYAAQLGDAIYVIDAFKKKSKRGIKTPRQDVDRIKARLKLLKEQMR